VTGGVCKFLKQGHVYTMKCVYTPLCRIGLLDNKHKGSRGNFAKRMSLGVHPVGWTALGTMIFFLGFLWMVYM